MENSNKKTSKRGHFNDIERPTFPKRAVITAGMPYGNKTLHFGHIGGVFIPADVFARFLRDRIGDENVIFVSGTDCYGSPIQESYNKAVNNGFEGSRERYVEFYHNAQKDILTRYGISTNLFGSSALGRTGEIHKAVSATFMKDLYKHGHLKRLSTAQFYDEKAEQFLNGRQVIGKCPVQGCQSQKAYADECDLGHQYRPSTLIDPKSTITGETPSTRPVSNWYFDLPSKRNVLEEYARVIGEKSRGVVKKTINEFLEPPVIYVKNEFMDEYMNFTELGEHELIIEQNKNSFILEFKTLEECDRATELLASKGIRFRTGKTLVPFRLTGNIEWGVPSPVLDGESPQTVWVWPESLWAPISFTAAYFDQINDPQGMERWRDFWCSKDCEIYQFIGQDNIFFYGAAQQPMFMALQGTENITCQPDNGNLQPSVLVANHHLLFLDKKASSSGQVKPPMADELLDYYTPEQLRMHFLALGLDKRSVSFFPKPLNPLADENATDPVLAEGALLTHVFNRIIRTAIYECQKHFDGKMPIGTPDHEILVDSERAALDYERHMSRHEFHMVTYVLDAYIRKGSKYLAKVKGITDKLDNSEDSHAVRREWLINVFHVIKTSALMLHPIAPDGTEMIRQYLQVDERIWSWDYMFAPLASILHIKSEHPLKHLEPRVDFFKRHESQLVATENENKQ